MGGCCVIGCTNRTSQRSKRQRRSEQDPNRNRKLSYHRFPKDTALKLAWEDAIQRDNWSPSKNSAVCSDHFHETDFDPHYLYCAKLKNFAIPTLFPVYTKHLLKKLKKSRKAPKRVPDLEAETESDDDTERIDEHKIEDEQDESRLDEAMLEDEPDDDSEYIPENETNPEQDHDSNPDEEDEPNPEEDEPNPEEDEPNPEEEDEPDPEYEQDEVEASETEMYEVIMENKSTTTDDLRIGKLSVDRATSISPNRRPIQNYTVLEIKLMRELKHKNHKVKILQQQIRRQQKRMDSLRATMSDLKELVPRPLHSRKKNVQVLITKILPSSHTTSDYENRL